jgi:hypothetical protein
MTSSRHRTAASAAPRPAARVWLPRLSRRARLAGAQRRRACIAAIKALLPNVNVVKFVRTVQPASVNTADWISEISKTSNLVLVDPICAQDTDSVSTILSRHTGGKFAAIADWPTTPQEVQQLATGQFIGGVTADFWGGAYIGTRLAIDAARGIPPPKNSRVVHSEPSPSPTPPLWGLGDGWGTCPNLFSGRDHPARPVAAVWAPGVRLPRERKTPAGCGKTRVRR